MDVVYEMERFGAAHNPSALYREGVQAERMVADARARIAHCIHAHADELIFTAGGTEANNIALLGTIAHLVERQGKKYSDLHIIVSAIEHSSVLEVAHALERRGVQVDYAPVDAFGIVDLAALKKLIRPQTVLVSVMAANNEIGTVQPVADIAKLVRHARAQSGGTYPLFHSDACQLAQYVPIRTEGFGPDLITFDAHKMYGPRSIGALWVRRRFREFLEPVYRGGGQERALRPGTESVPAIVGFAAAFEYVCADQAAEVARIEMLRQHLVEGIKKTIVPIVPGSVLNGHELERLPHIVHMSLPGIDTEMLVLQLDAAGIACSTKSSCMRDEAESYVVRALGAAAGDAGDDASQAAKNEARFRAQHTLRLSMGRSTTERDVRVVLAALEKAIQFQLASLATYVSAR
jgi:cysteine desulfurase